ncbi:MAG: HEAT repeat domain-containing protein, partial [Candidatus Aminicenantes bacterium]|nr:HEAT repeat domain-containing protein [Candidatus Aminicenantes bacterium]
GDKPFFSTLSHFLHKHEFQAVDTHDFMTAVKEATGQNMDWFFDMYLYKPGHPVFDVDYTWDNNAKTLKLKIAQVQDTSLGIPIYSLPVNIGIVTSEGRTSEKIWLKNKEETFEFQVKEQPLLVRFDEGNYLLKEWTFEKTNDDLLYQLKHDDVIGRMWAATELFKFKDNLKTVSNLVSQAENDDFWAVRQNAVETLKKIKRDEDIDIFKRMSSDENSKVRIVALSALGEFKKPELVSFFVDRFEKDDSYSAQAEALRSIAKCGGKSSIPFLEKASQMESPRNVIKRAADAAIEAIKEREKIMP